MSKILLVFENYTEMVVVETQLKRVGFDTVGIGSELSLSNHVIELNPSIIVAYGQGNRVSTLSVAKKLKEMIRWNGKVILIFPESMKPTADDLLRIRMDMALEAPPKVERIIQVIARLQNLDEIQLLEKLQSIGSPESADQMFKSPLHQQSDPNTNVGLQKFRLQSDTAVKKDRPSSESERSYTRAPENDGATQILEFLQKQEDKKDNPGKSGKKKIEPIPHAEGDVTKQLDQFSRYVRGDGRDLAEETRQVLSDSTSRMEKYKNFLTDVVLQPQSTLQRKLTRRVQQQIMQGISMQEVENQDERRRDFTRALFQKRK